jgi:hypothetical protein
MGCGKRCCEHSHNEARSCWRCRITDWITGFLLYRMPFIKSSQRQQIGPLKNECCLSNRVRRVSQDFTPLNRVLLHSEDGHFVSIFDCDKTQKNISQLIVFYDFHTPLGKFTVLEASICYTSCLCFNPPRTLTLISYYFAHL